MRHYNDFLIKLQTLDIKTVQRPTVHEYQTSTDCYELSHQNPSISQDYRNELKELRELALTDILSLGIEQIGFQLKRLEEIKTLFRTFSIKAYSSGAKMGGSNNVSFLEHLDLGVMFIIPNVPIHKRVTVTNEFIYDIELSIESREKLLQEFEQSVLYIAPIKKDLEVPVTKPPEQVEPIDKPRRPVKKANPVFKEGAAEQFFDLIKEDFEPTVQPQLKDLLLKKINPDEPLLFGGHGNQLADAFKQLYAADMIISCSKTELNSWILKHFKFIFRGESKTYRIKYLEDIISSNNITKQCQSPIIDVLRKEGQFIIVSIPRNNRKSKIY